MVPVTVTLGGREYAIQPLTIRKARAWREQFSGPFERIVNSLSAIPQIQLDDGRKVMQMIGMIGGQLLTSTDVFLEMLLAYSPALKADEEYIMDNATDEEAMAAFAEVLKLAYPFGPVLATIRGIGREDRRT